MNCSDAKRHLDLFLDGELDVETNLKVLEHLNLCSGCSRIFDGERWLCGEVRAWVGAGKAPEGLKAKLGAALDREAPAPRRRWAAFSSAAAAAIMAAVVGWALLFGPAPSAESAPIGAGLLAQAAAQRHEDSRRAVPPEGLCVCSSCEPKAVEALEAFFARNGARTCYHPLESKGYVWKSGSVWKDGVRGRTICWTVQETTCRGKALSHASLPASAVRFEGGSELTVKGHTVRRFDVGARVVLMGEENGFV